MSCTLSIAGANSIFVSADGNDSNNGTLESPYYTITKAVSAANAGDTIFVRGGTYNYTTTISIGSSKTGTSDNWYNLFAFPGEKPVLDFYKQSYSSSNRGISLNGGFWYIKGLAVKNAGDNGLHIGGSHNRIENCIFSGNDDTGLQISDGGSYNEIINCDSYFNADPTNENADGFAAKLNVGPGNKFIGCRAWNNSDDGWDLYEADDSVVIDSCWAFKNGYLANGSRSNGDGNGFKVGGNYVVGNHLVENCISFDNYKYGYHQNNNMGKVTIYNSIGFDNNNRNFNFYLTNADTSVLTNNISFSGGSNDKFVNCTSTTNSWDGFTVSTSDFITADKNLAKDARMPDGSLPANNFMRLAAGSSLIDAGTDVGIPYNGSAPDIGAFETNGPAAIYTLNVTVNGSGSVWFNPAGGLYNDGETVQLIADPSDNYRLENWTGDATGAKDTINLIMDGNKSVTANFTIINPPNYDSIRIEAEDMLLTGYTFYRLSNASAGKVVLASSTTSFDKARYTFPGEDGNYIINVQYYDQLNGASTYKVYVGDSLIASWEGDVAASQNGFVVKELMNVSLKNGDVIILESNRNGSEYGMIDYMDIVKSDYIPPTAVTTESTGGNQMELLSNYPNPFSDFTNITFRLPNAANVQILLYDVQGRMIKTVTNSRYPAGEQSVKLYRASLVPGIYYYKLISGKSVLSGTMSVK